MTCCTPLFTIAIPTYNRACFLRTNLDQLEKELKSVDRGIVEVLVSDNHSEDDTQMVVLEFKARDLPITYFRNEQNFGWGYNFAQCFNRASGKYVLLLGDDDLLVDGALAAVTEKLLNNDYGVVCIRPFGFDTDFRRELPKSLPTEKCYTNPEEFLVDIAHYVTLISACIVNRSALKTVIPSSLVSSDLAALNFTLEAAIFAKQNLFMGRFLVANRRNNSSNYSFSDVFIRQMWDAIEKYSSNGLSGGGIKRMKRRLIISYYPRYFLQLRLDGLIDRKRILEDCKKKFAKEPYFRYWLLPIIVLPKPFAVMWGAFTTITGRVLNGEGTLIIKFLMNKLYSKIGWRKL